MMVTERLPGSSASRALTHADVVTVQESWTPSEDNVQAWDVVDAHRAVVLSSSGHC